MPDMNLAWATRISSSHLSSELCRSSNDSRTGDKYALRPLIQKEKHKTGPREPVYYIPSEAYMSLKTDAVTWVR